MATPSHTPLEILWVFFRLGLTSFGGPIAHLGYFREEFVARRKWLQEQDYADLVALCQFLPGPASSQVGIGIGLSQGGLAGAIMAWLGFTLPSALFMLLFGFGVLHMGGGDMHGGWLHGLKVVAVAIVAQAVWGMAQNLCPDRERVTVAVIAACLVLLIPLPWTQLLVILLGGLYGWLFLRIDRPTAANALHIPISRSFAVAMLGLFFGLLLLLPLLANVLASPTIQLIDSFYRAGALVFGGGHVVLPLLQAEIVSPEQVSSELFLAGYGAAQAVPGPLFTFAAYLGTVTNTPPNGGLGALLALIAIFLPAFLLVLGTLPFWQLLRTQPTISAALAGVNAAVVGLLLAALYHPVWTAAITNERAFIIALVAFLLLMWWRLSAWLVVILAAIGGWVLL